MARQCFFIVKIKAKKGHLIHGVGLRERILNCTEKTDVSGFVKNIKEDGTVEIHCSGTWKYFEPFFERLDELKPKFNIEEISTRQLKGMTAENAELLGLTSEFHIVRDDDLQEMVWALQGASKKFGELADKMNKEGNAAQPPADGQTTK